MEVHVRAYALICIIKEGEAQNVHIEEGGEGFSDSAADVCSRPNDMG